ncbi:MAG: methylenetetrahydrofolate reductase [NAD(P)H] [Pirellulales bacterium]
MRVSEIYGPGRLGLSFELFPPKHDAAEEELFRHLEELVAFRPGYITCTYGAGGSTQAKTLDVVARVGQRFGCPTASHLTCVGATVDQLRGYLAEAERRGVQNIVALRGDPPKGETSFRAVEGGLRYANELVALIKAEFPRFGIAVAGYPEMHKEAPSPEADLENLRRKVDAGADVVLTQLFYDNDDFFRFVDRCQQAGIRQPIVPGVLPVTNLAQVKRIAGMCGARLPQAFTDALEACGEDAASQFETGVEFATRQVQALVDRGVPGVHFYVLNKSQATARILGALSV